MRLLIKLVSGLQLKVKCEERCAMKGMSFCAMLVMGGVCFAAEGAPKREVKTAGLFPLFGSQSACWGGNCGYSSSSCSYGNCYPTTARYPSYGYGYSNCGPTGCYNAAPVMSYPASAPVIYQPSVPYAPSYPAPYGGSYSAPVGYSAPGGYAPYAPVNYGVPYGAKVSGQVTAGYRAPVKGVSPFYP